MRRSFAGVAIIFALALPLVRDWLEHEMITHMLVQIPLLAFAGALLAIDLPASWKARMDAWNRGGVSGTLVAVIASSWWMVPRALDSALASPEAELLKFASLPLLVGAPLALSWRPLGTIGRGFLIVNVLPMWAVVGWMYVAAPSRVCNYYLLDQQVIAGTALLWVAVITGAAACGMAFRRARAVA